MSSSKKTSRKDPAWKYGKEIPAPNKSYKYIECNFCKQQITGGVKRMKEHLASTHNNVKPCPKVTPDVKKEISDYINQGVAAKQKRQEQFDEIVESGAYYGSGSRHGSNPSEEVENRSIRGPMDRFVARRDDDDDENVEVQTTNPTPTPTQGMFEHARDARRRVVMDIGKFFFENGISFNCIDSSSFARMCRSIANYGKGLKPPSRYELSTWVLKEEVNATKNEVEEVKKTWIQTGVSILSDGWKDTRGRSLINFLVNNPFGTVFLKSVDASNAIKDAKMLFQLLDGIVEEVGEELVVQVVTDNASNYKTAGKLLMEKRKCLYWTPCAAHCIDLMLEKIGELPQHKNALLKARKVSNFIYNHGFVLSMMRTFTKRELIRPAATRFATAFLTLESMLQSKQPLEAMFTSSEWANSTWAAKTEGKAIKKIILSENGFWSSVVYALKTTRPLVKVLRMVDGEKMPAMGFIYGAIDAAKEEIAKNLGNRRGDYKEIWEIIDAKWEHQLHRDIHAAAYFLNPRYQYAPDFSSHIEVKKGLIACMEKMIPPESLTNADLQLDEFRMKLGLFGRRQALATYNTRTPANWWIQFGDETPELQSFAVKILSLTYSASACERNWSMFNQVHTKKRNRLATSRLNSLVYVMYNRRLKERHIKVKSRDDSIDPLEEDYLPSDDEWYVAGEDEADRPSGSAIAVQMDDEIDEEIQETSSSSRRKRKKSTNSQGKRSMNLIDEEESEGEGEDEDVMVVEEIPRTRLDVDEDEDEDEEEKDEDNFIA